MISLIYLISALLVGASLTRRLGLKLLPFEAPALAIALGLILWTWLSLICAMAAPYAYSLPLTVLIAAGASWWLWNGRSHSITPPSWHWLTLPGKRPSWIIWGVFTATTTLLLGWLMWTHDLILTPTGLYSAAATWADLGLHASLISHFSEANQLSWDFPVASGARLTYPFMVDLLSAWLVQGGWSIHLALFVPGLLLAVAFLQLMLGFGVRLFHKLGGAVFGLSLFLLCGSAAGLTVAWADFQASQLPILEFLASLPRDYTILTNPNAQVTNVIADTLLPQRAFLMGFVMFATVMILLIHLRSGHQRSLSLIVGGLIGLMPLVHAHTYLILMAILAGLWVEALIKSRRFFNPWFYTGLTAVIVALPQIAWQSLGNGSGTGGHLALGWVIGPNETLLSFWANNYGFMLPLMLAVSVILVYNRPLRKYLVWYIPVMVVFIAANIYSLQPFEYDNLKLILYAYLMTCIFAGYGSIWLIRHFKPAVVPVALIVLTMSIPGALAVIHEFQRADQFASIDDIMLSRWVKNNTYPTDVFLTSDRPNQPIATLSGRSIVVGYRGWLYDYNLNYEPRLSAVQAAMQGQLTANNPYNARYLAVSTYEPPEWTVNQTKLTETYRVVYANPSWTVYRLNE